MGTYLAEELGGLLVCRRQESETYSSGAADGPLHRHGEKDGRFCSRFPAVSDPCAHGRAPAENVAGVI